VRDRQESKKEKKNQNLLCIDRSRAKSTMPSTHEYLRARPPRGHLRHFLGAPLGDSSWRSEMLLPTVALVGVCVVLTGTVPII
jgi:hypothetical protein